MQVYGEDEIVLGAETGPTQLPTRAPLQLRPGQTVAAHATITRPAWMHPQAIPTGVSLPKDEMDYLSFDSDLPLMQFTSTSGSNMKLTSFPQRPFRGERIIASAVFLPAMGASTDASDLVFIDPAVYVGAVQVGAAQGPVSLGTFRGNSFGVRLSFPPAAQGTRFFIPIRTALTPGAGDVIQVSFTVIGKAMR